MYFSYDGVQLAADSAAFVAQKRALYGDRGQRIGNTHTWTVKGEVVRDRSATDAQFLTAIKTFHDAYQEDGGDAGLYLDDGTATVHVIRNADAFGDVRVTSGPNYPVGDGPQFATVRDIEVQIEWDELISGASNLMSWRESITQQGTGGTLHGFSRPLTSRPKQQTIRRFTTFRLTQTGEAKGYKLWVQPELPMFPNNLIPESYSVSYDTPEDSRGSRQFRGFVTRWSYSFESASRMTARPKVL